MSVKDGTGWQEGGRRSSDLVLTSTGTEKGIGAFFCTCDSVHGSVCVICECVCIDTRLNP